MTVLQIEHHVPNYEGWKKAFESDPIGRKQMGVQRYRIYRPTDDPNYVVIDLEFDDLVHAQTTLDALKALWSKVQGVVVTNPKTRILDVIEYGEC